MVKRQQEENEMFLEIELRAKRYEIIVALCTAIVILIGAGIGFFACGDIEIAKRFGYAFMGAFFAAFGCAIIMLIVDKIVDCIFPSPLEVIHDARLQVEEMKQQQEEE